MKRKTIGRICMIMGLAVLSVPFFLLTYGKIRNRELLKKVEQTILEGSEHEEGMQEEKGKACSDETEKTTHQEGDIIGIIEIEALNLKYPIVEGTENNQLSSGIGHITDTAGIGEKGNCVLAGHRGSRYGAYFKYLNKLNVGDTVRLTETGGKVYLYQVTDMKVVGAYDNSVKNQGEEKELTLLTCENSGTMRLIVRCIWKEVKDETKNIPLRSGGGGCL